LPQETRYRAFISYSHADKLLASKLHRQLEGYRLPSRLAGTLGARGEVVPVRLTPIFRDIDELPASDDLSAEIRAALAASGALIVLCSPNAKTSEWVTREITLFRDLHGDTRPVLAAVIAGDPASVLPEALQSRAGRPSERVDPIAADFRPGQDGAKLALLKLVSGLTGVSLATLVQRDAQRRLRRVMAVTALSAIIMLALVSSLVLALRARAEAERNRNEAEGLVEYMLTDLRERLKGVGRLDVMAAVNARAMIYYSKQGALDSLPPESLEKRARVLHAMGEDDGNGGNYGPALDKFMAAHRTTATILAQRPNDPEAIFAHAQSEFWVGSAALRRDDRVTATRYWQGYLTQAERLLKVEPDTPRALMEMGYAHGNLCELNAHRDFDLKAAEAACLLSIDYESRALKRDPANRKNAESLANRHGWMAILFERESRFDAALKQRGFEGKVLKTLLSTDPQNVNFLLRAMWQEQGVARIYSAMHRFLEAQTTLRSLIAQVDRLALRVPDRGDVAEYKLRLLLTLADSERQQGSMQWHKTLAEIESYWPRASQGAGSMERMNAYRVSIDKIKRGEKL
jgi:tetratricopeptide (TPR) repeat protein